MNKAYFKFALLSLSLSGSAHAQTNRQPAGFAVVELFTSEGCSSCPAAERTLAKIKDEYKQNVCVLEFHVDYWNYLGWKDEFSSKEYTLRQQKYASVLHTGSTYTPQAIINGNQEMVGSDYTKISSAIDKSLSKTSANQISLSAATAQGTVAVNYNVANLKNQLFNIVLVKKAATVNIKKGENGGRQLEHHNIVLSLNTIATENAKGTAMVNLPAGVKPDEVYIIAYAQQKSNWATTGAAQCGIDK